MNFRPLLLLALLLGFHHCGQCSTNITLAGGSLSINTGQVAKIVSAYLAGGNTLIVSLGVRQYTYYPVSGGTDPNTKLPIVLVGPATIAVGGSSFCTVEVSTPDESFVPSNAVVIPADSAGPVNIILESSADLVTWTAALPGTYGANTTNRFFRVRAQRTP